MGLFKRGKKSEGENKEEDPYSNRPQNTKFKQQKLDAWQPILTPNWVIITFLIIGLIFVPVGIYLWIKSGNLFETVVIYDSYYKDQISSSVDYEACHIINQNQAFEAIKNGTRAYKACTLDFTFDQDIDSEDPVYVYYQISNFYQNHRRYVKSISQNQLLNDLGVDAINPITSTAAPSGLTSDCDPKSSLQGSRTSDRILWPCGLIANSFFNDGIELNSFSRGDDSTEYFAGYPINQNFAAGKSVNLNKTNIAWESDLSKNYRNPTATGCSFDPNSNQGNLCPLRYWQYQYAWQTYNQLLCYPQYTNATSSKVPDLNQSPDNSQCVDYTTVVKDLSGEPANEIFNTEPFNKQLNGDCAKCKDDTHVLTDLGGIFPPFDAAGKTVPSDEMPFVIPEPTNTVNDQNLFGIRSHSLIVWANTAGLSNFRKLFAVLTPPQHGFKKGDKIQFTVQPNFVVQSIKGSKALLIGTTGPLGAKNNILGIAYLTVGAVCLALALAFFIKKKVSPRKLGDPMYLQWQQKNQ